MCGRMKGENGEAERRVNALSGCICSKGLRSSSVPGEKERGLPVFKFI